MTQHILVLDEGTTSTRAVLFDTASTVVDEESRRLAVHTPSAAIVEQDATEIAEKSVDVLRSVLDRAEAAGRAVAAIGLTNQRTTTVLWDRATGEPVAPVIGWQDSRAQQHVDSIKADWGARFTAHTGLQLAPANVVLHLAALLEDPELRRRAEAGELLAGTPDSWVIWTLTGGPEGGRHVTSCSNAGSTGAFDLLTETWWQPWLDSIGVPVSLLPAVVLDDGDFGATAETVLGAALPIRSDFADQQAALFGHGGFEAGAVKCTHGTGSFIDFNVGGDLMIADEGLDTRLAWRTADEVRYLYEGSSFVTGSAIDWLVDGIKVLRSAEDLDTVYDATPDTSGVICVPALAGFTAPYWDQTARGAIFGLHRGVTDAHLVKATVDGIARTAADLVLFMAEKSGTTPAVVLVDGGLSRSNALLGAQANFTGVPVERPAAAEYVTARGAAWMAGLAVGVWGSREEAARGVGEPRTYEPTLTDTELAAAQSSWTDATNRALGWRPQSTRPLENQ